VYSILPSTIRRAAAGCKRESHIFQCESHAFNLFKSRHNGSRSPPYHSIQTNNASSSTIVARGVLLLMRSLLVINILFVVAIRGTVTVLISRGARPTPTCLVS